MKLTLAIMAWLAAAAAIKLADQQQQQQHMRSWHDYQEQIQVVSVFRPGAQGAQALGLLKV